MVYVYIEFLRDRNMPRRASQEGVSFAAVFWGVTQRCGERCVTPPKTAVEETTQEGAPLIL